MKLNSDCTCNWKSGMLLGMMGNPPGAAARLRREEEKSPWRTTDPELMGLFILAERTDGDL